MQSLVQRLDFRLSAVSFLALCAGPALAETRAADIWAEWQVQSAMTGQTIAATLTPTANGLVLTDYVATIEDPGLSIRSALDRIEMVENADGSVDVTFSDTYNVVLTFETDPGDPAANIELLFGHQNLRMTVTGDPGNRTFAYSADRITMTEGRIWGGGNVPPTIEADAEIVDVRASYTVTGAPGGSTPLQVVSDASAGRIAVVLDIEGPARDPGNLKAGLYATNVSSTSSGTLLALAGLGAEGAAFPPGFAIESSTTYSGFGFEMALDLPDMQFQAAYSNAGGLFGASISEAEIAYEIAATGMRTRFSGSEFPVPVDISVGSSTLLLSAPLAADPEPQDVALRLAYQDVTMSDALWGMIDAGGAIPRNPASIVFDATGQVQILVDLMTLDPEEMAVPPAELRALSVNELRLSVGGAELGGTAEMTFAPGQIMPMPVGSANLSLSGGNALLDALIAGGLVPADQGAFVRGAANVFARPGAAPDTLESVVVFGADGSITANGIPLQ